MTIDYISSRWALVVVVVLLAGCTGGFGATQTDTITQKNSVIDVGQAADTVIVNNDSRFRFDGQIGIQIRYGELRAFDDVHMCLYDSDEDLVKAKRIGDIDTNDDNYANVSVTADQNVHYIIVDHPKFRSYDNPGAMRLVYDREFEQYRSFGALDVSLEYDVDEMKGGCAEISEA